MGMKGIETTAFSAKLASLAGPNALSDNDKQNLAALPCALGFDIKNMPALACMSGDNAGSLAATGITIPSLDQPGYDFLHEMPAIRDQGDRGTCVAHAVTRCYEHLEFKTSGRPAPNTLDYSEQFLYWNTKDIDGRLDVDGTWASFASTSLINLGICLEATAPYVGTVYPPPDTADRGPKPSIQAYAEALGHRADQSRQIVPSDTDALKAVIASGLPVAYSFPVFRSWYRSLETRSTGFITMPIGQSDVVESGHCVTLTGWGMDDTVPGGGYFILDNSWSTDWGAQNQFGPGRGILPFKYAQTYGTEAYAVTFA
jgi:C1A family cysteine protease